MLLKSFVGRLAKWRYETIWMVLDSLLKLRELCQQFLTSMEPIMGSNFKDKQLLVDMETACKWDDLWCFMQAFFTLVIDPLEKSRRWGLVCKCHQEDRHSGMHNKSKCWRASRRLDEARLFILQCVQKLMDSAKKLTLDQCGNCQWVFSEISVCPPPGCT